MDADPIERPSPALSRPVRLARIDPARDMARFYTLSVEVTLFSGYSCTREFGRIGQRGGRLMVGLFDTEAEARAELARLLRRKLGRGYRSRGG